MATLPVKWFDWRFHGLPGLSGTPGTLTTILDAVLVNGFGDTKVVTINVLNKKPTAIAIATCLDQILVSLLKKYRFKE